MVELTKKEIVIPINTYEESKESLLDLIQQNKGIGDIILAEENFSFIDEKDIRDALAAEINKGIEVKIMVSAEHETPEHLKIMKDLGMIVYSLKYSEVDLSGIPSIWPKWWEAFASFPTSLLFLYPHSPSESPHTHRGFICTDIPISEEVYDTWRDIADLVDTREIKPPFDRFIEPVVNDEFYDRNKEYLSQKYHNQWVIITSGDIHAASKTKEGHRKNIKILYEGKQTRYADVLADFIGSEEAKKASQKAVEVEVVTASVMS